jgi:hypothetical protein
MRGDHHRLAPTLAGVLGLREENTFAGAVSECQAGSIASQLRLAIRQAGGLWRNPSHEEESEN